MNIDYVFIKNSSSAKSNKLQNNFNSLENHSFFSKLRFIFNRWDKNDFIIINGYNNYVFVLTYLLNIFSRKKKFIAIESDTQLRVPKNIFKKLCKSIYLNSIFQNKHILGLSGGSVTHKKLFKYYGLSDDRLFLLPMVVDNNKFFSLPKKFPNTFTYLFVGRLIPTATVLGSLSSSNAFNVALTKLCGFDDPLDLAKTSFTPALSKTARIAPPALTPVP